MKRIFRCIFLPAMAVVMFIAQPALGQSLADRLDAVRRQRAEAEARALQADAPANPQVVMLQELFYSRLTVDFDQTPARDVFDFLNDALALNLTVRYSDDAAGHGIDPESMITLSLADATALDVLEQILEQCSDHESCTWQLRKTFIEVGTKERLGAPAAQYVRMYPVADLLFEPPNFEGPGPLDLQSVYDRQFGGFGAGYVNGFGGIGGGAGGTIIPTPVPPHSASDDNARELLELILMTVEPEAWTQLGGNWASIKYFEGTLIVRAPEFIHRQLGGYPRIPPPAAKENAAGGSKNTSAATSGGS